MALTLKRTVSFEGVSYAQIRGILQKLFDELTEEPLQLNGVPFSLGLQDNGWKGFVVSTINVDGSSVFISFSLSPMKGAVDIIFEANEQAEDFFDAGCAQIEQLIRKELKQPEPEQTKEAELMSILIDRFYPSVKDNDVLTRRLRLIMEINRQIDEGPRLSKLATFQKLYDEYGDSFQVDEKTLYEDCREIRKTGLVKDNHWFD